MAHAIGPPFTGLCVFSGLHHTGQVKSKVETLHSAVFPQSNHLQCLIFPSFQAFCTPRYPVLAWEARLTVFLRHTF